MNREIFETHVLSGEGIPFIYHSNFVCSGNENIANWHENTEFLHFVEGEGEIIINGEIIPVKAPAVFIVNSGLQHAVTSNTTVRYNCLIPDLSFCIDNGVPTDNLIFENLITDAALLRIFDKIHSEYVSKNEFSAAGIRSSVLEMLVFVSRNFLLQRKEGVNPRESVRLAISYIRAHFKERLSVEKIADEAGLSRYYFQRLFKKETGETPISYINILKCDNAKKMLKSGKYSVNEVSTHNGFDNLSYFSKVFKKYTGFLPSEYKKANNV